MMSRMTRVAAAVVVALLITSMYYITGGLDGATSAFAQIHEAIAKMPWRHIVVHARSDQPDVRDGYTYEQWFSYESQITISKHGDSIRSTDPRANTLTVYDPGSNSVTVSPLTAKRHRDDGTEVKDPLDLVGRIIESLESSGATVQQQEGRYESKEVDIYIIELPWEHHGMWESGEILELIVERQSQLLIARKSKKNDSYGNATETLTTYDYPTDGPADIYDAGVPRTATVRTQEPDSQLDDVLEMLRSYREAFPQQYMSIASTSLHLPYRQSYHLESAELFFVNKELYRKERRLWVSSTGSPDATELTVGSTFESNWDWWWGTNNADWIRVSNIDMCDGKYSYGLSRDEDSAQKWSTHKTKASGNMALAGQNPITLAWPLAYYRRRERVTIEEDEYSQGNSLICIQMLSDGTTSNGRVARLPRQDLFYMDPDKDYICQRSESRTQLDAPWQSDPAWLDGIEANAMRRDDWTGIREVLEYAQTETGKWYPARIRTQQISPKRDTPDNIVTSERLMIIYLKETTEFPDGIFDAAQLPSAVAAAKGSTGLVRPPSDEVRQQHYRDQCRRNLRHIGNCIALYMNDYDAEYPPNLRALVEKESLPHQALHCPVSGNKDDEPSYVYRGADLTASAHPSMIAAYDKSANHQGQYRNVLLAGLLVKEMTEDEFLAAIAHDNKVRRRNGLEPKPPE